jgi:hypothetical protein
MLIYLGTWTLSAPPNAEKVMHSFFLLFRKQLKFDKFDSFDVSHYRSPTSGRLIRILIIFSVIFMILR